MKTLFTLPLLLCAFSYSTIFGQFTDNFDDGNIDGWMGETSSFIANVSGQMQLQGDCVAGGQDYVAAAVATLDSVVWEFYVALDFDPTSSNYARVYLQSDQPDLTGSLNGYFLKIGADGTGDVVELYRQDDLTFVLVFSGITNINSSPTLGIKVVRTATAEWQLYIDPTGGTSYTLENSGVDAVHNGGNYFGFFCKYTSTRCNLFYFDNIYIDPLYIDVDAPDLISASVISPTELDIDFNENVDISSAEDESNYSVDAGIGQPVNATRDAIDFSKVHLTFLSPFPEAETLTITVNDVADENGNGIISDSETFSYYTVKVYDVVIDEIMADPEPVVGTLPDAEYLELFNQSPVDLNLSGWTISDGSTTSDPFQSYTIPTGGYVIITDDGNASLFSVYPNVIAVGSFPALNNDGDLLTLYDNSGLVVHDVDYSNAWYDNSIKENGGWSLEMIDPQNPCTGDDNWNASEDENGGTPGELNSIYESNPDITSPAVTSAYPLSDDTLIVYFDEPLELALLAGSQFSVDNGIGTAIEVITQTETPDQAGVVFSNPFETGIVYTLTVSGVQDCSGNIINSFNTVQFGMPEPADSFDIAINEILFNPVSGGVDFVELYNRSEKIIDMSKLIIGELYLDDSTQVAESAYLSDDGKLFFPGTYIVLSSSTSNITSTYLVTDNGNFFEPTSMPNYPDDEGIVVLYNQSLNVIDELHFYDDWHYALLSDKNGVSLERLNYDRPTQDPSNWHSAASDVGYATPGYQNSTFGNVTAGGEISLEYAVFSPDGDGYHDLLIISYETATEGFTANMKIYDSQGRLVKDLVNNELLSREGFFTWDGTNDEGTAAKMGIYILYAEFFNLDGQVEKHKIKFTLVRSH